MFNKQLLRVQIQNAQKRQASQQCFFVLLGSVGVNVACTVEH